MIETQPDVRFERKFVAAGDQYHHLRWWLRARPDGFSTAYPPRRINNAYFDRGSYQSFDESLSGVSERDKVRYRWYGPHDEPRSGQLEVKRRRNRVGWKLTFPVELDLPERPRWSRVLSDISRSVPAAGRYWLAHFAVPMLINRYQREYFVSADGSLRVTLDACQQAFDQRYSSFVNTRQAVTLDDVVVMEVKCAPDDVDAASEVLSDLPISVSRHSKYCSSLAALAGL
jgi:hypothetical protein